MDLNRFQRAAKLQDAGQIAEALKEYQSLANAITDVGEKASVMLNEVNCLSQLGENEQARKRLSEVYNLLPEHSEMRVHAQFTEALLYKDEGKDEQALKRLNELLADHGKLLRTPSHEFLWREIQIRRGIVLSELGRSSEARPILEEALSFEELANADRGNDRGTVLYYLARSYLDLGEFILAEEKYVDALKQDLPEGFQPLAHYELGLVYYQRKAFARAIQEFELAESKTDESCLSKRSIWEWLSVTCKHLGLNSEADRYEKLAKTP
ncbi:MAG: hypothetical protein AUF79_00030 [Crenarchaeota archaeon 13_1_20CM_2_51_8]|nr:MAG: hypothetical protein AUF79_00030 [Crenarchaeota archaeon 13_1_20CM_2_51_8]